MIEAPNSLDEIGHSLQRDPLLLAAEHFSPTVDPLVYQPGTWVRDKFDWLRVGKRPTDYQFEILDRVPTKKRVAVRGPHGLGKTALAAWLTLWFSITREMAGWDWKVVTTASAWRQLEIYLWPEIHKWARLLNWEKVGRNPFSNNTELLMLTLKLKFGQASAVASDEPSNIEGAHADHLLYILDEAKTIPPESWEAIEGAFSNDGNEAGAESLAFAISTPGEPVGVFFDIQSRKPGYEDWDVRAVTLEEAIRAGRISQQWADQRKKHWGEGSAIYINRVLGNFATTASDGVIPLSWAEAAMQRPLPEPLGPLSCLSVDVARSGDDQSIIALRHGRAIKDLIESPSDDTMGLAGVVVSKLKYHKCYTTVDVIGLGAGVFDRIRELGYDVEAFNASEASRFTDSSGEIEFLNRRAEAWWNLRMLLDPANNIGVSLPQDEELLGDLCAPHYKFNSQGKLVVESKDDIRKRLGRSTDRGDAVVMAFAERYPDVEGVVVYDQPVTISPF